MQGATIVLNCGIGNVNSLLNACLKIDDNVTEIKEPSSLKNLDVKRIILPGVGAVGPYLEKLKSKGFIEVISDHVVKNNVPFLGICVGMQILATQCEEFGTHKGLDLIPGNVIPLKKTARSLKTPHVGWNNVSLSEKVDSQAELNGEHFYFVHSNYFSCDPEYIVGLCDYGLKFAAIVKNKNIYGVQFHPEKSSHAGELFLRKFICSGAL